jgi:hypothetical protein
MDSLDTMELMDSMEQVEKQQKKGNQPLFKDLRNFDVSLFHAGNRGSNPLGDASTDKGMNAIRVHPFYLPYTSTTRSLNHGGF